MIFGTDRNRFLTMVEILMLLDFKFHLTGSRFFGNATDESDWDFFAEYDMGLLKKLFDLGFYDRTISSYGGDTQLVYLMEWENIQIQLVRDIRTKIAAQALLALTCREPTADDWDKMYEIACTQIFDRF